MNLIEAVPDNSASKIIKILLRIYENKFSCTLVTLIKQEVEYFANDQSQKIYASQECSAVCSVDTRLHGVLRDWALVVGARLIWNWKCC